MIIQQIVNLLCIGSVYALMSVGYSLVYSILNFTNFAHGIVVTAGAYIGFYSLGMLSLPLWLSALGSMCIGALVSITYERLTYRPLRLRGSRTLYLIITGMGVSVLCENLIIILIGPRFKAFPNIFPGGITVLGAVVPLVDVVVLSISLASLGLLQLFIRRSKLGLATRAAAYNLFTAEVMGVDTDRLVAMIFGLAGALAGLAGIFLGLKYTAYPQLGWMTLKAFISAVFGGLGSLNGAVVGAYFLATVEVLVAAYVSSSLRDVIAFGLLVAVLVVRPAGLMGVAVSEKA